MKKYLYLSILFLGAACAGSDAKVSKLPVQINTDSLNLIELKKQVVEIKLERKRHLDANTKEYVWDSLLDLNFDGKLDAIFESKFDYPKPNFAFQNSLFDMYYFNTKTKRLELAEKNGVNLAFNFKDSLLFEQANTGRYIGITVKKFKENKWKRFYNLTGEPYSDSLGHCAKYEIIRFDKRDTTTILSDTYFLGTGPPKSVFPFELPNSIHWQF